MKKFLSLFLVCLMALEFGCGGQSLGRRRVVQPTAGDYEQAVDAQVAQITGVGPAQPQQPSSVQPGPVVPSQPYVTGIVPGQPFSVFDAKIEASDNMSVKVLNPTKFYACVHVPEFNGAPVLRLREGRFQQDLTPRMPWMREVGCSFMIMPSQSRRPESAKKIWLATEEPGSWTVEVSFYTYSYQPRKIPGSNVTNEFIFPNTSERNAACPSWYSLGCVHNWTLIAELMAVPNPKPEERWAFNGLYEVEEATGNMEDLPISENFALAVR